MKFEVNEQITEENYKFLKAGDILYVKSKDNFGPHLTILFKEATDSNLNCCKWMISKHWHSELSVDKVKHHKKEYPYWDTHSLRDMGIQDNSYNDHTTHYLGCISLLGVHSIEPEIDSKLTLEDLELIKMHIIHSSQGWTLRDKHTHCEQPDNDTLALLKKVCCALGEPNAHDKDYGFCRIK